VPGGVENIAYLTVFFEDSALIGHINVNWLSPVKLRRALIGGSRRMIVYDDMEPSEKVRVYDRGITVTDTPERLYKLRVGYRAGDMHAPQLDVAEPLRNVAEHFIDCIAGMKQPVTDGAAGLRVVEVLEAASRSMRDRGRLVELPGAGRRAVGG
jgi:predicted dehydrogenase